MINIELLKTAIEKGEYKISFEEPNNIELEENSKGERFYVIYGDDVKFGVSGGYCYVEIAGYSFSCDLGTGEWEWDEDDDYEDDDDYIDEDEVIELLESIPGVLYGEMLEPDQQMKVYYKANPNAEKLDYYWYEDDDIPCDNDDDDSDDLD